MDRRGFLKRGVQKAAEAASEAVTTKLERQAERWVRPPYALPELDFLLACTRCGECIEACPHDTLFPLSGQFGPAALGTPAMDLIHHSCHLCEDWPCVKTCTPRALALPEGETDEFALRRPIGAVARIVQSDCLPYSGPECGACADSCPVPGALKFEGPRPFIDADRCVGCARCREVCIVAPKAIEIRRAAVGHERLPDAADDPNSE